MVPGTGVALLQLIEAFDSFGIDIYSKLHVLIGLWVFFYKYLNGFQAIIYNFVLYRRAEAKAKKMNLNQKTKKESRRS